MDGDRDVSRVEEARVSKADAQFDYGKPGADDKAPPKKMSRGRKLLFILVALVVLAGLIVGGVLYWLDARQYESTDDASVDGHISQVAFQIAGRVLRLAVDDNQEVAAGQVLLELDGRDYQARLDQTQAQLGQSRAQATQARAQLALRQADIDQGLAQVRVTEADAAQAQADYNRYRAINPGAIARQQVDTAASAAKSQAAKADAARQAVLGTRAQLAAQHAMVQAADAGVRVAETQVANAELQLSYTKLLAPLAGRVTRRTVELGNYVNPGQALLSVVPDDLWITANFKETQLALMKPGQDVEVRIDAVPGAPFHAKVQSFQSGTGSVFSSLPAENATGNYVKVTQRLPVKIVFDDPRAHDAKLAPGMSATPRVKVR